MVSIARDNTELSEFLLKFIPALLYVGLCFEAAKYLSGFHYHFWDLVLFDTWLDPHLTLITEWRTTVIFLLFFLAMVVLPSLIF